jgi:hypothetical protein
MLQALVIWASLQLALAAILLFLLGHRLQRERPLLSLMLIQLLGWASWCVQSYLTGAAPTWPAVLIASLGMGAWVTRSFRGWNPVGHASLGVAGLATLAFLAYAAQTIARSRLEPGTLAVALLLLGLQLGAMVLLLAHTFEVVDTVCRTRATRHGARRVVAGFSPKVSLHVPIHDEPPELVARTLDALAALRYPDFEVIVVDNNTADEDRWRPVERHCAALGPRFRFYHLMPWPGYKAGALNYALSVTAPEAAIVGVVDADYVVEADFLADLVGHFADPGVAFVQTPQDYRDADARGRYGRALYLAYLYFFKVSMASRNERNAIIYAGTMGLIRRSALLEVGRWDEWCVTEDAEVAVRLLDAGFRSVYVDRTYGRGLMPLDAAALRRQRYRWAFGGMQLLRMHARRLLLPEAGGRLTPAQRLMFLSGGLQWLNDPLTFAFSVILLLGAGAMLLGRPFRGQPLLGATVLTPLLFILFALTRFLWALRVRLRCTWREAADALTVLLGLTWVVTQACIRGLVSRRGVFLRTPKQGPRPTMAETLMAVRVELLLGVLCGGAGALLALQRQPPLAAAHGVLVALLAWQAAVYLSAVRSALWNYRERRAGLAPAGAPRGGAAAETQGRRWSARRLGTRVAAGCVLALVASPARAEAQEVVAGWEGNAIQGYAFLSPVASVDLGGRVAILLRGTASHLYYRFPDSNGATKVTSPGVSGGLALRVRAGGTTATIGAAYELRRSTRRLPDSTSQVTERGLTSQADVYAQATPLTALSAIVSYGAANRYVWARAGVQRQITDTRFQRPVALVLGVEGTAQGNHDARSYGAGGLVALALLRARTSLQLRAGSSWLRYADGSRETRPYLGLGFYRAF